VDLSAFDARFRILDPETGRFLQMDPAKFVGGDETLYGFVGGNPTNLTDPSGLHPFESPGGQTWWRRNIGRIPVIGAIDRKINPLEPGVVWVREYANEGDLDDRLAQSNAKYSPEQLHGSEYTTDCSVGGLTNHHVPGNRAAWQHGMAGAGVLATVGIYWAASGPMWASPAGESFAWVNGRWVNNATGRPATAAESAAASNALQLAFNPANFVGRQAVTAPNLPAGTFTALVVDGQVYVARFHSVGWQLAGRTGNVQYSGWAEIDGAGRILRLFQ